jgi:hypothetical protein
MLPTKFRFIWPSGFSEDFLEIDQSETRIVYGGHVCGSEQNVQALKVSDKKQTPITEQK